MYRSVAVTTDLSAESTEAFGAAALVAKKFGAKLCLLHVAQSPTIMTPWQVAPGPREAERRYKAARGRVEDLARKDRAFTGMKVDARAVEGDSADAVCDFQEREHADLIVMATRGHSGIKHFLLGSFTAKVLQLASCPILVFRTQEGKGDAAKQPFSPSRILVPCDFSHHSRKALEAARSWARAFDSVVKVLYVVDQYVGPDLDPESSSGTVQEYYAKHVSDASEKLEELVASSLKGMRAESAVRVGHPALEILEEAEAFGARLITLSSRGLSALDRIAMGSVAERVIQGAKCPVLVAGRNPG